MDFAFFLGGIAAVAIALFVIKKQAPMSTINIKFQPLLRNRP